MSWKKFQPNRDGPPPKIASGTIGKKIDLLTNYFRIRIHNPNLTLIHYDVTIKNHNKSEKIPKRLKRDIFYQLFKQFPKVFKKNIELAYDGEKNAYSAQEIEGLSSGTYVVNYCEFPSEAPQDLPRILAKLKITEEPQAAAADPIVDAEPPQAAGVDQQAAESQPPTEGEGGKKKKRKRGKKGGQQDGEGTGQGPPGAEPGKSQVEIKEEPQAAGVDQQAAESQPPTEDDGGKKKKRKRGKKGGQQDGEGAGQGPPGAGQGPPGAGQGPPGAGQGPPGARQGPPGAGQGQAEEKKLEPIGRDQFYIDLKVVARYNLSTLLQSLRMNSNKKIEQVQLNILDTMFQHHRRLNYTPAGRNSFFSMNKAFGVPHPLSFDKEGHIGFFGAIRPAAGWKEATMLLNIDKAHTAFYKEQKLIDFISTYTRTPVNKLNCLLDKRDEKLCGKEISYFKVRAEHTPIRRRYKVVGFGELGADRQTFELENKDGTKRRVTVQQYLQETYNYRLNYPKLNLVRIGSKNKTNYLPAEVLTIDKGQRVVKKLTDKETADFIKMTARPPNERLQSILQMIKENRFSVDPMLRSIGFEIDDQPVEVTGRVLPSPIINVMGGRGNSPVEVRNEYGVWDIGRSKNKFFKPMELNCWAVQCFDRRIDQSKVKEFIATIQKNGRFLGMTIKEPVPDNKLRSPTDTDIDAMFSHLKTTYKNLQLIMCIMGEVTIYHKIKKFGDYKHKVLTQCIRNRTVMGKYNRYTGESKIDNSTINNILLKINAKLGGINNIAIAPTKLPWFYLDEPVLIMGADVNHPPAGSEKGIPSLAAVVANNDMHCTQYCSEVRAQKQREEVIKDLREMTESLLNKFYNKTRKIPKRIIMYRDGVSESQFIEILASEMMQIREACKSKPNYQPPITFICVQKRHNTRLFAKNSERDGVGKSKNVPPGTVVDTTITHPKESDYYLVSHQGIQGTSRPTHYHVLWDDSNFAMDVLQAMTFNLCHVYSRCSRSVSLPTPVYYAHLAAFRAKTICQTVVDDTLSSVSSDSNEAAKNEQFKKIEQLTRMDSGNELSGKLYYV